MSKAKKKDKNDISLTDIKVTTQPGQGKFNTIRTYDKTNSNEYEELNLPYSKSTPGEYDNLAAGNRPHAKERSGAKSKTRCSKTCIAIIVSMVAVAVALVALAAVILTGMNKTDPTETRAGIPITEASTRPPPSTTGPQAATVPATTPTTLPTVRSTTVPTVRSTTVPTVTVPTNTVIATRSTTTNHGTTTKSYYYNSTTTRRTTNGQTTTSMRTTTFPLPTSRRTTTRPAIGR